VPNVQSVEMYAGETRTLTFYGRDASNNPVSLTGKTVEFYIGRPPLHPDYPTAIITKTGTGTDIGGGVFTITLAATDTTNMHGDYEYMAKATTTGTGAIAVIARGRFRVYPVLSP
jgi:hypothetical protein